MIFFLFYLPYLSVGKKVLGFLPEYFTSPNESFNLGLKVYLLRLFPGLNQWFVTKAFAVALIVAAGAVWVKRKENAVDVIKLSYLLAGLQIVLTSVAFHPWYVLWIIPFLSLFPSPAWVYFSLVVPFSYLKYEPSLGILPEWVRHVEYIPFFILLAIEYAIFQRSSGGLFPWKLPREKQPLKTE
jgi:hypothetical protein